MSKYVMSDIHGCYEEFIQMLDLIKFNEDDELYILGDIFDRGLEPLKILDYIIGRKNITLIKGNHEKMFEEAFEYGDYSLWYRNGGHITHSKLIELGPYKERQIYNYIKNLPLIKIIDNHILVHAGLYFPKGYEQLELNDFIREQSEENILWSRENIDKEKRFKNYTIIFGHTPVQMIKEGCNSILKRNSTIYIDCGCVFKHSKGRLACLRLDDYKEYYVEQNTLKVKI